MNLLAPLHSLDRWLGRARLRVAREGPGLITLLFHSLLDDDNPAAPALDPQQRTTSGFFREVVAHLAGLGYQFVRPAQIAAGLPPTGRYALLTFDDGYYNNRLALPILEEFAAPAVFYVVAGHVQANRCMWSDVVYRHRWRQGWPLARIRAEQEGLKHLRATELEAEVEHRFGPGCLQPWGNADRFFTPPELRQFAQHPLVEIGNHTQDHAILTNYEAEGVRQQVEACQQNLWQLTGRLPSSIAYPNGNFNPQVLAVCRQLGLTTGVGVWRGKNYLPLQSHQLLDLQRFTPVGDRPLAPQMAHFRADRPLWGLWRRWR
ncbi:MAG: polysaccharide deacetylase family protein [Bernardetiaceae bacterium]|jgi:peptidoglycan/xylan/chitin deacetylase (PgdA/CDA1 family)|nr:polysaccharide deacetylase family protein [Bernardetiaceae bacterium]